MTVSCSKPRFYSPAVQYIPYVEVILLHSAYFSQQCTYCSDHSKVYLEQNFLNGMPFRRACMSSILCLNDNNGAWRKSLYIKISKILPMRCPRTFAIIEFLCLASTCTSYRKCTRLLPLNFHDNLQIISRIYFGFPL